MRCNHCGYENTGQPRFCRECGSPLLVRCPQCGAEEPPGAKFCGECGVSLQGEAGAVKAHQGAPPLGVSGAEDERNASVVFADISRYTTWAAESEAGDIFFFLREWYSRVVKLAERYEGHFSRAEGDCVMVILGAPIAYEDHPERACRLALDLRDAFSVFVGEYGPHEGAGERMAIHIGVNTGPVAAGRMSLGDGDAFDILGHTVNLARRLQTCAGPGAIYAGQDTHTRAARHFEWRELPELSLKGLTGVANAYELLRAHQDRSRLPDAAMPFVGRGQELSESTAAATAARGGSGQVLSICGEPGIGKSRLVHEFTGRLKQMGFRLLMASCFPDERAVPYCAIARMLRDALGIGPGEDASVLSASALNALSEIGVDAPGDLLRIQGILGGRLQEPGAEMEDSQRLTRRAGRRAILALAERQPLGLVVEDLQWTDALSRDFLDHMVPWLVSARVLLLCTFRPGSAPRWADAPHARTMTLPRLTPEESRALATSLVSESDSEQRAAQIAQASGGNPLFIHELARSGPLAEATQMPATVRDVITARMDGLTADSRRALMVSAVVGPRFRVPLVADVLGQPLAALRWTMEDLVSAGWVRPTSLGDEDAYDFDHMLAREAAYARLPRRDRGVLHRRVAEAIEADPLLVQGDRADVLAHHYYESDARMRAAPYLQSAMQNAEGRAAPASVLAYGEKLMALLDQFPDLSHDRELVLGAVTACAEACAVVGRSQDALGLLRRRLEMAEAFGDESAAAESRFSAGMVHLAMAEPDRAMEEIQAALSVWHRSGDPSLVARARLGIGSALARRGEYEAALAEFRSCFEAPEAEVAADLRAAGHQNYGEVCNYLGRPDEALDHFAEAERLNDEVGDERLLANIHGGRAQAFLAKGRTAEAQSAFERAAELAERTGDVLLQAEILIDLAQCQRRSGDVRDAVASLLRGIELAKDAESPGLVAMGEASLARTHWRSGERELARAVAERALVQARAIGHYAAMHLALRVLADFAEGEQRQEAALDLRLEALALAIESGRAKDEAAGLLDLGRSRLALTQYDEARRCFEKAMELASERGAQHLLALAAEHLAQLHLSTGEHELAVARANEAVQAARSVDNAELAGRAATLAETARRHGPGAAPSSSRAMPHSGM